MEVWGPLGEVWGGGGLWGEVGEFEKEAGWPDTVEEVGEVESQEEHDYCRPGQVGGGPTLAPHTKTRTLFENQENKNISFSTKVSLARFLEYRRGPVRGG